MRLIQLANRATGTIGILGMGYKADTDVMDDSPSVRFALWLALSGRHKVIVYDPFSKKLGGSHWADGIEIANTRYACIYNSQCVFIMTPLQEFYSLDVDLNMCATHDQLSMVVDCWRLLDPSKLVSRINLVQLGKCQFQKGVVPIQEPMTDGRKFVRFSRDDPL